MTRSPSKQPGGIPNDECDGIEMDLSCMTDENTMVAVQDNFSDVLLDIHQQVQCGIENVHSCLTAIAIAYMPLTPESVNSTLSDNTSSSVDQYVVPASTESAALISIWHSEYATCRKMQKQNMQQTENVHATTHQDLGDTSLMIIHDTDSPLTHPQVESSDLSLVQLNPLCASHHDTCESICNQWTLNNDQMRAFNIIANHTIEPAEKAQLKMLLTGPASSRKTQVLNALCQFFQVVFNDCCL